MLTCGASGDASPDWLSSSRLNVEILRCSKILINESDLSLNLINLKVKLIIEPKTEANSEASYQETLSVDRAETLGIGLAEGELLEPRAVGHASPDLQRFSEGK